MSLIDIVNLTFAYPGSYDTIFEKSSFQIDTDWKLGFTGRNGRGKTTFLHLLMGRYDYSGSLLASVDFSYFPYEVPAATLEEGAKATAADVIEWVCPGYAAWEMLRELSLLDVEEETLDRPYTTLSPGERTKILLAALFCRENNFLLIDEPTNHLDQQARDLVSRYLRGKKGFILVSHDRTFLDGCIDHILSINKTTIEIQQGNFSSWLINKERQDAFELAQNAKLQKDVVRLTQAARQTAHWSDQVEKTKFATKNSGIKPDKGYIGHKSAKMMKRSKGLQERREKALEEKASLLQNIETAEELKLSQLRYPQARLVSLTDVAVEYGGRSVFAPVRFSVERGDRIALCGRNGSGKTSLLRLIGGQPLAYTGSLLRGSRLRVSYVAQDTSFLQGSMADYARESGIDESLFKTILRKLDFSRGQFTKDMQDLSEGQKKKVLIARSLCEKSHLLLWDEPLNYIDVISRMQIEELLLAYKPTILFVEHDKAFCETVASKVIEMEPWRS